jgi:hypothetical protein
VPTGELLAIPNLDPHEIPLAKTIVTIIRQLERNELISGGEGSFLLHAVKYFVGSEWVRSRADERAAREKEGGEQGNTGDGLGPLRKTRTHTPHKRSLRTARSEETGAFIPEQRGVGAQHTF